MKDTGKKLQDLKGIIKRSVTFSQQFPVCTDTSIIKSLAGGIPSYTGGRE